MTMMMTEALYETIKGEEEKLQKLKQETKLICEKLDIGKSQEPNWLLDRPSEKMMITTTKRIEKAKSLQDRPQPNHFRNFFGPSPS